MAVEWRVCPDHPRYLVSSDGDIVGPRNTIMKWQYNKQNGYFWVKIQVNHNPGESAAKVINVHHLVCTTFHGPRPSGKEAMHKDEDKSNNRSSNLRWGTKSENIQSMWDKGARRSHRKSKSPNNEDLFWQWLRFGWMYRAERHPRLWDREEEYVKRLKYEASVFIEKDFVDYMLFISDALRWAKDVGIPIGPGRGSSAASLVCWLLRITEVDPMLFPHMLFERFIDINRMDPPDIDTDLSDDRRDELRNYLVDKYGADRVGNIGNFVRYQGKSSVNDVARVYNLPYNDCETIKGLLIERSGGDSRFDSTLGDTIDMFPAAKAAFDRHPELQYALQLEGNYRGMNVHAAGLVVANRPIDETCALITRIVGGVEKTVLPYDKKDCSYLGMLKIDALSLSTLGAIGHTLDMIGMSLDELYSVPLDDDKTIQAFRDGDVVGIFQFEGRATRMVNIQVQPEHFLHLSDINALSRPGPLFSGMTEAYIEVKNGRREQEALHPIVDARTSHTYGQILYQEQVLAIIREMGGFPYAKISEIRRIISQKLGEANFNKMYMEFVDGAARLHDVDEELATRIWKYMVTSATYSFNSAHSVSYSMLGYWSMWLKMHYPVEFFAGAMRKVKDDKNSIEWKRPRMLRDAQRHSIAIFPPDLQNSSATWTADSTWGALRAGFRQIPGVGEKTAVAIEQAIADDHDTFQTWGDLLRIPGIGNKTVDVIRDFALSEDPFELELTGRVLNELRGEIRRGRGPFRSLARPTHNSDQLPRDGNHYVTWLGIVKHRQYKDYLEDERARSGSAIEDILKEMRDPHLLKSCVLQCYDDGDDEVYIRFNRWIYPRFKDQLESVVQGQDIVLVSGKKRHGFGLSIQADTMFVISMAPDNGMDDDNE